MSFREFHILQTKHDGLFLKSDMTLSQSITHAGRFYDIHEAIDTGFYNFGNDFHIFTAFEKTNEVH